MGSLAAAQRRFYCSLCSFRFQQIGRIKSTLLSLSKDLGTLSYNEFFCWWSPPAAETFQCFISQIVRPSRNGICFTVLFGFISIVRAPYNVDHTQLVFMHQKCHWVTIA